MGITLHTDVDMADNRVIERRVLSDRKPASVTFETGVSYASLKPSSVCKMVFRSEIGSRSLMGASKKWVVMKHK